MVEDICSISPPCAYVLSSQVFQNLNFKTDFNLLSFQTSWLSLIAVTLVDIPVSYVNIPSRQTFTVYRLGRPCCTYQGLTGTFLIFLNFM